MVWDLQQQAAGEVSPLAMVLMLMEMDIMVIDIRTALVILHTGIIETASLLHHHRQSADRRGLGVEMAEETNDQTPDFHLVLPQQITFTMAPEGNDQKITDLVILTEALQEVGPVDPTLTPIFQATAQTVAEEMTEDRETEMNDLGTGDLEMRETSVQDMTVIVIDWSMMIVAVVGLEVEVEVLFQTAIEERDLGNESRCLETIQNETSTADSWLSFHGFNVICFMEYGCDSV